MLKNYNVRVGDRFYLNNFSTRNGHVLPDYLIVTDIQRYADGPIKFVTAKYENRATYTKERILGASFLDDSNLNPLKKNPSWIFVSQKLQSSK